MKALVTMADIAKEMKVTAGMVRKRLMQHPEVEVSFTRLGRNNVKLYGPQQANKIKALLKAYPVQAGRGRPSKKKQVKK